MGSAHPRALWLIRVNYFTVVPLFLIKKLVFNRKLPWQAEHQLGSGTIQVGKAERQRWEGCAVG